MADNFQTHFRRDQEYLCAINMRGLLEQFVRDTMIEKPENVYVYMVEWAQKQKAIRAQNSENEAKMSDNEL